MAKEKPQQDVNTGQHGSYWSRCPLGWLWALPWRSYMLSPGSEKLRLPMVYGARMAAGHTAPASGSSAPNAVVAGGTDGGGRIPPPGARPGLHRPRERAAADKGPRERKPLGLL